MFKLIAIRPLTGCASHIHKCLRIGMMYYFCKDFVINESRTLIKRTSKNIKPLKEDFFSLKPLKEDFFSQRPIRPIVNISAIVGMNGDGKSSLIELMMRLVNNCAVDYKYKENHLHRIEDVIAELYYLVDDVLYRMAEEEGDKRTKIWKMADLKNQDKYEWEIKEEEVTNINENPACFFFTLVSNYSHYAYNIRDFKQEWEETGSEKSDSEKCWLHYVFHKNDDYQSPITLHPFRHEGNIDVNLEYDLSRQRLLSIILNASHPKSQPDSLRRINHKDAEILSLTELPYSKLQEESIVDYFRTVQNDEKLGAVLEQIERVGKDENNRSEYQYLIDDVLPERFETPLIEIMAQDDEGFIPFVREVIKWLQTSHKTFYNNSDIRKVIDRLNAISLKYEELRYRYGKKRGILSWINVAQLGRLDTIYRIMKRLHIAPSIAYKDYKDLTLEEKCHHYMAYKVLSIMNTDSHYKDLAGDGDGKYTFREYDDRLEKCIDDIMRDSKSHVTREIRQVNNFLKNIEKEGIYKRSREKGQKNKRILVNIDELQKEYQGRKKELDELQKEYKGRKIELDELPPPIFEWTLLFKKEGDSTCDIELNSFSSGEKQMLYSLCSIIYHLQNLNNTENANVNLILEEIELYFHPECQRSIINRLLELLHGAELNHIKNLNIIFVTHSPFVLSDIPKCNVMFLQDGMVKEKDKMQENTFGANIHSLLKNGFFLPNLPMGEFAYQKINSLFEKLNSGDFNREKDLEDIYQQILLVGEPFLRNQLLNMYNAYRGFLK